MKTGCAAVALFTVIVAGAQTTAERRWQTGTWVQMGLARTLFVSDVEHERMPPGFNTPARTQVATYVIETDDRRYELQAMVKIGSDGFDLRVTIGNPVTFAVERKTAYIKLDDGEHRLLVLKNDRKKAR